MTTFVTMVSMCLFIALLSFKPSEPYLSEYLICNESTQSVLCSLNRNAADCSAKTQCEWLGNDCSLIPCSAVETTSCSNGSGESSDDNPYPFDYCVLDESLTTCDQIDCHIRLTEDQVNNEVYPWSTYAYLPFLVAIGAIAEIKSYRLAILCGVSGR